MVPVLVEFLRVEVGGEVGSVGGVAGKVVVGCGVVVGVVVGAAQVVDRGGSAVRGPGGGRDHTKWPVET